MHERRCTKRGERLTPRLINNSDHVSPNHMHAGGRPLNSVSTWYGGGADAKSVTSR